MENIHNNPPIFTWESEVKDSELDIQGIVNNSVYFVYMEHCRHKHLKVLGLNVIDIHHDKVDLVIRECTIKFKNSLTSGDEFIVSSKWELINKAKVIVHQNIIRKSDQTEIVTAAFTVTGIDRNNSKIGLPTTLIDLLNKT